MLARSPLPFAIAALERALKKAKKDWSETIGPMHLSTKYWTQVFELVYASTPAGNDDPRWDTLFRIGMPLLRKIEGRQTVKDLEELKKKSGA